MSEIEKCKECGNKEIYQGNLCFKCFGKQLFSGLGEKNKEQQLQDRIDKAIEYITNNLCDNKVRVKENISGKDIDGLLEILEGDKE